MTAGAIILPGLGILPVAFEARRVTGRRCFETSFRSLTGCFAVVDFYRNRRALVGRVAVSAFLTLMVALGVRITAGKLKVPRLLVMFRERTQITVSQARARARVTDGTDSRCYPPKKQRKRLAAVTLEARIVIRVTLNAGLCFRSN
jgi:hypothetical protein